MRDRIPALDGLRAVACLAVVLHHAGTPGMQWGWLGVDAFFVLSGYLITGLLLAERERTGRIRFARFYLRRAARLYPALLIAVAVSLALPTGTSLLHAAWTLAYLSDVVASLGGNLGWLAHTWSMSVEEHFYLAWPLAVLLCRTRRAVAVLAAAGVTCSLGLAFAADGFGDLGEIGYFSTPTRAWELLLGCVLACLPRPRLSRAAAFMVATVVPASLTVGIAVIWGFAHSRTVLLCVAAVLAAVGVILGQAGAWSPLAVRPLPQIGLISYGVYLFHPIPLALMRGWAWEPRLLASLTAGLGVAAASYRWVERPIQRAVKARTSGRTVQTIVPAASRQLAPSDQTGLPRVVS